MSDKPAPIDFVISDEDLDLEPFWVSIRGKRYAIPSQDQLTLDQLLEIQSVTKDEGHLVGMGKLLSYAPAETRKAVGALPNAVTIKLLDAWADQNGSELGESSPSES